MIIWLWYNIDVLETVILEWHNTTMLRCSWCIVLGIEEWDILTLLILESYKEKY